MPPSPKRMKKSPRSGKARHNIAFQGCTGAFSEIAAKKAITKTELALTTLEMHGKASFAAVFEAVESGEVEQGIVPIENSVGGTVKEVYDLLVHFDQLHITAECCEVEIPCLCAPKGATVASLTKVSSDAYHLQQCSHFLASLESENNLQIDKNVVWDSAGSCEVVATDGSKTVAAIASKEAAYENGLEILKQNVSNLDGIATRYVFIGKEAAHVPPGGNSKCSIAVLLRNESMALMRLTSAFALRGMNITKLETQPACAARSMYSGRHFDYLFFVDFEPESEEAAAKALDNVREFATSLRVLGTYKKSISLDDVSQSEMPWTAYY